MRSRLFKEFSIQAAHWLPSVPADHKCRRLRGHSFKIDIHVEGEVAPSLGWVLDFDKIKRASMPIFVRLDHHCLNDIEELENPTSENLAAYIWRNLNRLLRS